MMGSDRRVTLLLLDGARPDVFGELAAAGDLPNISRLVLERGGVVPATTVFPSTTGVAYLPFLTGCYPGTCNVPGIRWLDRARYQGRWWRDRDHVRNYCGYQGSLLNGDVSPTLRSLFDCEPDAVALCTPWSRGLRRGQERAGTARLFWGGLAHYTGGYGILDRAVGRALVRAARERRRLVFAVFPGVDGVTHFFDPWHPEVTALYRQFDAAIGRYAAAGGFDGDHLAVIVSDHGMSRVERHTEVSRALEARGLPTLRHPLLWRRDPRVALAVSGNASAQLYLDVGRPRERRWEIGEIEAGEAPGIPRDLVEYLAHLPGVALVAGPSGADLVVASRAGRAHLTDAGAGQVRYVAATADVLRVGRRQARWTDREALAGTIDGPYPDAPTQLLQLFRSPRGGDLALVAAPGYDLRREWEIPEHRSGHGSLIADHMRTLLAVSRPLAAIMRTVDVFPLVVDHLGRAIPRGIDGALPEADAAARREVA